MHPPLIALLFVLQTAAAAAPPPRTQADHAPRPALHAVLRVVDQVTHAPVAGAVVWSSAELGGNHLDCIDVEPLPDAVTDAYGEARIDVSSLACVHPLELLEVEVHAVVHHPGYLTETGIVWLTEEAELDEELSEPVLLNRGRSLVGRVLDATGAPVFGASVRMGTWNVTTERFDIELESAAYLENSRLDGRVSFDLASAEPQGDTPSEYEVFAWHPSHGVASVRVSLADDTQFTVRLAPSEHRRCGRIASSDGASTGPMLVELVCTDEVRRPFYSLFDPVRIEADGCFDLHVPFDGAWVLRFRPVFAAEVLTSAVPVDSENVPVLERPGAWALVRIVDERGAPIRVDSPYLAPVERTPTGARPPWPTRELASEDPDPRYGGAVFGEPLGGGVYAFSLRSAGVYGVRGEVYDSECTWVGETLIDFTPGESVVETTVTLRRMPGWNELRVTVLGPDGVPVPRYRGVVASAVSGIERYDNLVPGGESMTCSIGGSVNPLTLPEGRYIVRIAAPGLAPAEQELEVLAGRENAVTVRLAATPQR